MTELTKTCRMCGEEIKAIARRCPHCTHYQSKFNFPLVIVVIVLVFLIATRLMAPARHIPTRETIYGSDDKLIILETNQHKFIKESCCSYIAILGKLKNQTEKEWNDVHFEVQFFNDKNELVDTLNASDYSLIVAPHETVPFRIHEKASVHEDQYKRYQIKLTKAQEDYKF